MKQRHRMQIDGARTIAHLRLVRAGHGAHDRLRKHDTLRQTGGAARKDEGGDIGIRPVGPVAAAALGKRSEEHTSELQSLIRISYAVFCLKNKNTKTKHKLNHIHMNTA